MKIVNQKLDEKASDVSSARGTALLELRNLTVMVCLLAAGIFFGIGSVVDVLVSKISFETEVRLFGSMSLAIEKEKNEDIYIKRAETILEKLKKNSDIPPLNYRLVMIDIKEPNAFAFPGGTIGVTRGLMNQLNDDTAIAFVLGHEIGHFHNRDHLRGFGRSVGMAIAYGIIFGGRMGDSSIGNILNLVLQRQYSRQQEDKADQFGVELVCRAYDNVETIDKLFKILEEQDKMPKWAYMFATHPDPKSRVQKLKQYTKKSVTTF
ncbi:M48 family metallopeptidase [Desulfobacterales bacterium HSG16]|nr:M48 family metallopeptidase [Desulfobacterales bacterium HSG16]